MSRKQANEEKKKKQNIENQEASNNGEQDSNENQQKEKNEAVAEEENSEEAPQNTEQAEEDEQVEEDEQELLKRQLEKLNDKHLRLIAEYDNFRKRTLREKMELSKTAGESVLLGLLPVIDDFDRARSHLDDASDIDAVIKGIDLIYIKFKEFLKQQGVTEIETKEQEFDGDLHEAVTKIPAPSDDMKGKIIDCVQKGYKLNDKVIRHPKVVVGE